MLRQPPLLEQLLWLLSLARLPLMWVPPMPERQLWLVHLPSLREQLHLPPSTRLLPRLEPSMRMRLQLLGLLLWLQQQPLLEQLQLLVQKRWSLLERPRL